MFDQFRLKDVLAHYKQNFVSTQWGNEKYKWEAVKWFQDNWDVNAQNFPEMLNRSLDKTFNLLASSNNFPKGMIVGFAKAAPEEVRAMFIALFDESKDVYERMNAFKLQSSILLEKYGNGAAQHYQYENAISTYLWLRYPDKYYIYKFGEVKTVANELEAEYHFKKGAYADNIRNFLKLYDEISLVLKEDTELVNLFQSQLTGTCYPDPELKTLTIDVGFYISRFYAQKDSEVQVESGWFPATYTPGFSEGDWMKLLGDLEIFTTASLEIMKRMKDYGGQATCTQLAVKYGESKNFYSAGSSALAKRIADKTGCPVMEEDTENSKWWPILYVGRYASKEEQGSYTWRLRDELSAALDKVDLSGIELYVKAAPGGEGHGYWWLNANPKIWSFSDIAVGAVQSYTLYNENGNKRRIFQNFLDAKAGDMIIGYESNPVKQIVAIGRVSAEQDGEKLFFEKVEGLTSPIDYATLKGCPELERMDSVDGFYSYQFDRLDEHGLPRFKNLTGNSSNMTNEEFLSTIFAYSGTRTPTAYGSFSTEFMYKKLSLRAEFSYKFGYKVRMLRLYQDDKNALPAPEDNMAKAMVNRWRQPGDEAYTTIPGLSNEELAVPEGDVIPGESEAYKYTMVDVAFRNIVGPLTYTGWYMYDYSDLRVAKADNIRIRSISLGYTLGGNWLKNLGVGGARVDFSVQNIGVIVFDKKLKGQDPDQVQSIGMPTLPTYNLSLNVNF